MRMNYFFTSDRHFGHTNILRYCKRPFQSIQEHDEVLIANWNRVVTNNDIVYHLGDFCFGTAKIALDILNRLNFREFKFIWGNHDRAMERLSYLAPSFKRRIDFLGEQKKIRIPTVFKQSQEIVLNHYAMRIWEKSHYGAFHLYGHSHGSLSDLPDSLSFDVGVDCHNFTPISFERVREIMNKKTFKPIDHHIGK